MHIQKEVIINAPADKVWKVVGTDYAKVGDWASIVNVSGERLSNTGELEGRTCESTYGAVRELITEFDEAAHLLKYEADGLPAMFKKGGNTWKVIPVNAHQSKVTMDLRMELAPIQGLLMGWMIKGKMSKDTDQLMLDLKHFVETGRPTKAKQQSDQKFFKKMKKKAA